MTPVPEGFFTPLLAQPVMVDLRNVYDPKRMTQEGFRYIAVGRGVPMAASELAEQKG